MQWRFVHNSMFKGYYKLSLVSMLNIVVYDLNKKPINQLAF